MKRLAAQPWFTVLVLALAVTAMLSWTWLTWPDVLIDFGRELYVPWRLASGQVLYRDLAFLNGPLSPYLNAFWFRFFGVSLHTLMISNLILYLVQLWCLYRLLRLIARSFAVLVACLVAVIVFGLGQVIDIGNYNVVCPYSHEMTHGLTLSLGALLLLTRYVQSRRVGSLVLAGLALGLTFLTKVEAVVALGVAMVVGLTLDTVRMRRLEPRCSRSIALVLTVAVIPVGVALFCLSRAMPTREVWASMTRAWVLAVNSHVTALTFYQRVLGVDNIPIRLQTISAWVGWYGSLLIPVIWIAMRHRADRPRTKLLLLSFIVPLVTGLVAYGVGILQASSSLVVIPVCLSLLVIVSFHRWCRERPASRSASEALVRIIVIVFALTLLAKILLNTHAFHYGFALAMPATAVTILAMLDWIPGWIMRKGGDGRIFCAAGLAVVVTVTVTSLCMSARSLRLRQIPIAEGPDRFFADERGLVMQRVLHTLQTQTGPSDTLVVLPEGVMINYLARRVNPTPFISFLPLEVVAFGEDRMIHAFAAHPPDHILLIDRNTAEYGYRGFGIDYAQRLYAWVMAHYQTRMRFSGMPPYGLVGDILWLTRNHLNDTSSVESQETSVSKP